MAKKSKENNKEASATDHMVEYQECSRKLFELRNEFKLTRKLEKPHLIRKYKKDMARALTKINMSKNS